MAHKEQRDFCSSIKDKYPNYFTGKKVLDIGSLDINGNNRFLFTDCNYIGLDVGKGPNVDVVSVGHLYDGPDEYFDTIICTEVFEHDMFYEETVKNITRMLKPGGAFIFTCAADGRPEHGTRRCGEECAPLLIQISEEWADYYKNLMEPDFIKIDGFKESYPDGFFIYNGEAEIPSDLYFFGVKGGINKTEKYLPRTFSDGIFDNNYNPSEYIDDIFVVGAWPDTEGKENDLLECISRLRTFNNVPILLVSHYPIKSEIQKLVDYYIFDKENDLLINDEFESYDVGSGRWTKMEDHKVVNQLPYHHDYAIWVSMQHAFNFCKYLGKERVHYLEYDNLIDPFQYRQSFLEKSKNHDAVLYEYNENSIIDTHFAPFCATYIFSAKTDLLVKIVSEVNSKKEYFTNRPKGWQLERVFLEYLKKHTSNFVVSPYIPNNNELNTQAVWNRDGIFREGVAVQIYPCVDKRDELYLHFISGFHETHQGEDILLEVRYNGNNQFIRLERDEYKTIHLGKYKRGYTARVFLFGKEIFSQFLSETVSQFRKMNNLIWDKEPVAIDRPKIENQININFVDGAFVEITGQKEERYFVNFIDKSNGELVFQSRLKNNQWAKPNRKWFTDWKIEVHSDESEPFIYEFDATNKRVFIVFESSSLGDTLAWIPYVEEFRKKHNCHVIVSTFLNDLIQSEYPDIEFVSPGTTAHNLYALYRLGCFYDEKGFDPTKHKTDYRKLRLQELATDILGLDFKEIRPRIYVKNKTKQIDGDYATIGIHSTAQLKYWNNGTGWQDTVDYLNSKGIKTVHISKQVGEYMGNHPPQNIVDKTGDLSLQDRITDILNSKMFIGVSSGLSWIAWALGVPTILISGCTEEAHEPSNNVYRVINTNVCNSCFSTHYFDKGDWNSCPLHKGTERQFECSKQITFSMVQPKIDEILKV